MRHSVVEHRDYCALTDCVGKGRFFEPTLLSGCNHEMEVMTEESFGPVIPVQSVVCAALIDGEAAGRADL